MSLVDLPVDVFATVLAFLPNCFWQRSACKARVALQMTCRALWRKLEGLPCYKERLFEEVLDMHPADQSLCVRWRVCNFEHRNVPASFPRQLWGLTLARIVDSRLPPLPDGLQRLRADEWDGEELEEGYLPNSLKWLLATYDGPLRVGVLPCNLQSLTLFDFNQPLLPGVLPSSIVALTIRGFDRELVPGTLPKNLTRLELIGFRQPLQPGVLPPRLAEVTLPDFDHELLPGVLPPMLVQLDLKRFDQPLEPGALPESVRRVYLSSFDRYVTSGALPAGIRTFFSSKFKLDVDVFRSGDKEEVRCLTRELDAIKKKLAALETATGQCEERRLAESADARRQVREMTKELSFARELAATKDKTIAANEKALQCKEELLEIYRKEAATLRRFRDEAQVAVKVAAALVD